MHLSTMKRPLVHKLGTLRQFSIVDLKRQSTALQFDEVHHLFRNMNILMTLLNDLEAGSVPLRDSLNESRPRKFSEF